MKLKITEVESHMDLKPIPSSARKTIALIAHDNKKPDLLAWAEWKSRC